MKKRVKTGLVVTLMTSAALLVGSQAFAGINYDISYPDTHPFWEESGHSDDTAEAFNHWNGDGSVSSSCARCHSSSGYMDYLGVGKVVNATTGFTVYEPTANASATWAAANPGLTWVGTNPAYSVEDNAQLGQVAECAVCHDYMDPSSHHPNAAGFPDLIFPSGANVTNPQKDASYSCIVCHQGRSSGPDVDQMITDANDTTGMFYDMDTADANVTFLNVHYFAAGATFFGAQVNGGYQYDGKSYDHQFDHVAGYDSCIGCHDPHSLEVQTDLCGSCHSQDDPRDFRKEGSVSDYDGDGDTSEGIAGEISTLGNKLYSAIQTYAANVTVPIVYDSHSYPYWFVDSDNDGIADANETGYGNQYNFTNGWTPRLAKAAYNMQFALKDPGAFAHNAKYVIQLLYDSIEDLNNGLISEGGVGIDMTGLTRGDGAHFDGASEAFRHWDEEATGWGGHPPYTVTASCAKCHGEGLPEFLATGQNNNATDAQTDGMSCTNCHNSPATVTTRVADEIALPSGDQVSLNNNSNLCLACHSGRNAGADVAAGGFTNIHYAVAGASMFGTDGKAGYEYAGQEYDGLNFTFHYHGLTTCTACHMGENADHSFHPDEQECFGCHDPYDANATDPDAFANLGKAWKGEIPAANLNNIATLENDLLTAITDYAAANGMNATKLNHYPYWDGTSTWDLNIAAAAYNLQFSQKEHGAYIHNARYMQQLLYDSIMDLNGTTAVTRPAVKAPGNRGWDNDDPTLGENVIGNMHATHVNNQGASCANCHDDPDNGDYRLGGTDISEVVYKEATNSAKCNTWAVDSSGNFYCADGNITATVYTDTIQSCSTVTECHGSTGSDVYDENGTATRSWNNGINGTITDENYADANGTYSRWQ